MERFLTEEETARISGYSRYWLQKKRCTGGGPPYLKINGHTIRYPAKELVAWFNSHGLRRHTSQVECEPREPDQTGSQILRRMVDGQERVILID